MINVQCENADQGTKEQREENRSKSAELGQHKKNSPEGSSKQVQLPGDSGC